MAMKVVGTAKYRPEYHIKDKKAAIPGPKSGHPRRDGHFWLRQ